MQLLKKCVLLLCVLALLLGAAACKKPVESPEEGNGRGAHADDVVYATENHKITVAMLSYLVYSEYHNFCNYYGGYLPLAKGEGGTALDTTKPLREQNYSVITDSVTGEKAATTWFQFFAGYARENAEQIMVLCEAATAEGVSLDAAELQQVEDYVKEVESYAASNGMTTQAYLTKNFGADVTIEEVRAVSRYSLLATKQSQRIVERIADNVTDDTILSIYESNKADYDTGVDFLIVQFTTSYAPADAAAVAEALAVYEASQQTFRSRMDALAAATDRAAFEALLLSYFREDAAAAGKEDPDAVAAAALKDALMVNYERPESETALSTWLFDSARAVGDTKTFITEASARDAESDNLKKVSSSYTACFFVQGLHRNETKTRHVGHILFMTNTFKGLTTTTGLSGEVKALAESLLAAGKTISAENMSRALLDKMMAEGAITEQTDESGATYYTVDRAKFEDYGNRFTEDGSVFYDDVTLGMMVAEFEGWLYDDARHGNEISFAGAVETTYGFHIMYYGGEGEEVWRINARADAEEALYEAWFDAAAAARPYTEASALWDFVAVS